MPILDFLVSFINIVEWILSFLGIVLFAVGYKFIRVIYLIIGVTFGFTLGYLVGFVVGSTALSIIVGLILATVFGFFNFVHYQYFKGFSLGIMALIVCVYIFLVILSYVTFSPMYVIVISGAASIGLAVLNYKYEVVTTMLITSWLGAIFILYAVLDVFVVLDFSIVTALISVLLGIVGMALQYFVVYKKAPKQI